MMAKYRTDQTIKMIQLHQQYLFHWFLDEWKSTDKLIEWFLDENDLLEDYPFEDEEIVSNKNKRRVVDGLTEQFSDFAWEHFCAEGLWGSIQREINEGEGQQIGYELEDHPLFESLFATLAELACVDLNLRLSRQKERDDEDERVNQNPVEN
jgi:hypothetical protein